MLKGKYVIRGDADFYRTGQIIGIEAGYAVVKFDNMHNAEDAGAFPMELVCLHEMAHFEDEGIKVWGLFDTRTELDAFVDYMSESAEPPVKLVTESGARKVMFPIPPKPRKH